MPPGGISSNGRSGRIDFFKVDYSLHLFLSLAYHECVYNFFHYLSPDKSHIRANGLCWLCYNQQNVKQRNYLNIFNFLSADHRDLVV
jgi:hypothetical protein